MKLENYFRNPGQFDKDDPWCRHCDIDIQERITDENLFFTWLVDGAHKWYLVHSIHFFLHFPIDR